jgi:hypothetical protein
MIRRTHVGMVRQVLQIDTPIASRTKSLTSRPRAGVIVCGGLSPEASQPLDSNDAVGLQAFRKQRHSSWPSVSKSVLRIARFSLPSGARTVLTRFDQRSRIELTSICVLHSSFTGTIPALRPSTVRALWSKQLICSSGVTALSERGLRLGAFQSGFFRSSRTRTPFGTAFGTEMFNKPPRVSPRARCFSVVNGCGRCSKTCSALIKSNSFPGISSHESTLMPCERANAIRSSDSSVPYTWQPSPWTSRHHRPHPMPKSKTRVSDGSFPISDRTARIPSS